MSETGSNLRQIAQVLKSNGTDGELVMGFRDIAPEDINTKEPVFIYFDGLPVPFFMDSFVKRGSNKALVHVTDVKNFDDAEELVGKAVYADWSAYEGEFDGNDFSMLVGWTLLKPIADLDGSEDLDGNEDLNGCEDLDGNEEEYEVEEVGEITDFIDIPGNPCLEIQTTDGKEGIIPLHEDLILSVDAENRELVMEVPEGLF